MTSATNPDTRGGTAARQATAAVTSGAHTAASEGRQAKNSRSFGLLVMVGLIMYGVVHLLIAWITFQVAFTGSGQEASQQGAMAEMASAPVGDVLLWVTAVGFFGLVLWQVAIAIWGRSDEDESGWKKLRKRLAAVSKAVVYLLLGITALRTATEGPQSGDSKKQGLTAKLLALPFGPALVIAIGVVILCIGARLLYRGVTKKFTHDLRGGVSTAVVRIGQAGYITKGIAFGVVGVLFAIAGVTYDPQKAGGLDTAVRTIRDQPFGVVLLAIIALGIACFGVYCFIWSRHAKR